MPAPPDRKRYSRRVMLGAAAGSLNVLLAPPLCAAAGAVGLVNEAQASAFLERAGGRLAATKGSDIFLRDTAVTGAQPSRLGLQLGAATRIRLGANTVFQIDRFVAGVAAAVQLKSGAAFVERGHGAEPSFELHSPFALLAARGTAFFAGPSNGLFGVFVREGSVEVRTAAGSVVVSAGQGTDIAAPGAAPTPVKVWGEARIRAALASVD